MPISLTQLRSATPGQFVEFDETGFSIERRDSDPNAFNRLVREALDSAGTEFVAFPTTDGRTGYAALYVVPLA
ncbi:hypothetical protein [Brevundimonas bacteroides]|uniref:hypothetical protein n=1 Tax=Brevundimonas bacteroides TaxID=74311 RepID=UPI0004968E1D|nr:hypothetical protein [Brevundimonas bacteroides]